MTNYRISSLKNGLVFHAPLKGKLGPELVVNGTFDTDSDWNKGTGWTISGGRLVFSGSAGGAFVSQTISTKLKSGATYFLEFDYISGSQSTIGINIGDGTTIVHTFTSGVRQRTHIVAGSTNQVFWIYGNSGAALVLDNVSIKEVLPGKVGSEIFKDDCSSDNTSDWSSYDCTLTFDTDHYEINYTSTTQHILQDFGTPILGKTYYASMEIKNGTASGELVKLRFSNGLTTATDIISGTTTSSWTKIEGLITVDDVVEDDLMISTELSSGNIEIKNIIVREVETPDVTPYSNHGVVYGAVQNASSIEFDGNSDYIILPSTISLETFTISAFLKTSNTDTRVIFDYRDTANDGIGLFMVNNKLHLRTNSDTHTSTNTSLGDDTWHHVVGVYDGTYIYLYVDGALDVAPYNVGSKAFNVTTLPTIGTISYNLGDSNYSLIGSLKDVRVYNRALTAEEVGLLYKLNGEDVGLRI
jgi:hypothetical protein